MNRRITIALVMMALLGLAAVLARLLVEARPRTRVLTGALVVVSAVILVVGTATVLALILVLALSLRLRAGEIATIFKLGCSRATIARLLGAEIAIIVAASAVLCAVVMLTVYQYSGDLVRALFIR